jgi:hypothetical protein
MKKLFPIMPNFIDVSIKQLYILHGRIAKRPPHAILLHITSAILCVTRQNTGGIHMTRPVEILLIHSPNIQRWMNPGCPLYAACSRRLD